MLQFSPLKRFILGFIAIDCVLSEKANNEHTEGHTTCVDPENFVRGGLNLAGFFS